MTIVDPLDVLPQLLQGRGSSRTTRFAVHAYREDDSGSGILGRVAETFLGFEAAEVRAMGPGMVPFLMHPDYLQNFATHVLCVRALREGESTALEFPMRDYARSWRWIECQHVVLPRSAPNSPRELIGLAIETTGLKRAAADTRRSAGRPGEAAGGRASAEQPGRDAVMRD